MKGNSIVGKTISEITSSIKSEAISPTEIVQCHLEQIKKTNPHINAVVQINEEEALRQAEKIAESVKKRTNSRVVARGAYDIKRFPRHFWSCYYLRNGRQTKLHTQE